MQRSSVHGALGGVAGAGGVCSGVLMPRAGRESAAAGRARGRGGACTGMRMRCAECARTRRAP